jgi:hypothetical protein
VSAMIGQPVLAWGRFPRKFGLDSAQSERPQQELYARCSRRSLRRIADNALRRCPGTNALSDVTVRAVRWPALQGHSVTPGWVRRDGTFEAADHGSRGIGRQILVAALAIGSKLVIVRDGGATRIPNAAPPIWCRSRGSIAGSRVDRTCRSPGRRARRGGERRQRQLGRAA